MLTVKRRRQSVKGTLFPLGALQEGRVAFPMGRLFYLWKTKEVASLQQPQFPPLPAQHHTATDEDLLAAYRRTGQSHFLGIVLQRYTLLLLGVCLKYLKDKESAQDAVQQVFVKVITHMPEEDIQNFKGWLYVLARNYCLQLLRDKKYFAGEEVLQELAAADEGPSRALEKEMTLQQLEVSLSELALPQQTCIREFYLHQKSYQEIMDATGYSFAQVKSYIQNGKRNLRNSLLQKNEKKP